MSGGLVSLGMIGGLLHLKTPEIISEYMPIAKMLAGGTGLGGIMQSVMGAGGLQAIMSNPLGATSGQLQGTIAQGLSSLTGLSGVGPLVSSLTGPGGLSGALGNLTNVAGSLLSGQGVLAMVSHSNIADLAGSALPDVLGLSSVVAPLFADGMLSHVDWAVSDAVSQVVSGSMLVGDAVSLVQGFAGAAQSVADASMFALSTVAGGEVFSSSPGLASDISAVHTLAAVVASAQTVPTAPQLLVEALTRGLGSDVIQQMVDSVATHLDL